MRRAILRIAAQVEEGACPGCARNARHGHAIVTRDHAPNEGLDAQSAASASAPFATPAVTQNRSASSTDIDSTRTFARGTRMVKPPSW